MPCLFLIDFEQLHLCGINMINTPGSSKAPLRKRPANCPAVVEMCQL